MRRPYVRGPQQRPEQTRKHKINEEIISPQVRVIDENGDQLGVMTSREALRRAQEAEKDLVEIAPQAVPPVCRIIDYGKFSYEQQKREKIQKKSQQQKELKEIRLRAGTDTHDLDFKVRHSRGFLEDGHKVKASVMFRGREIVHQEIGRALLQKFIDALADVSKVDQDMRTEGRVLSVTLAPDGKKKTAPKRKPEEAPKKNASRTKEKPQADADETKVGVTAEAENETVESTQPDT